MYFVLLRKFSIFCDFIIYHVHDKVFIGLYIQVICHLIWGNIEYSNTDSANTKQKLKNLGINLIKRKLRLISNQNYIFSSDLMMEYNDGI